MKKDALGSVLDYVRVCAGLPSCEEASDAYLVERFAREHDGAAFAILVKRYGDMVFGICRRVAGTLHDAEDAFQATFLVLARRAGTIRRQGAVASWLHAVAFRVAAKARQARARRRERETRAARTVETAGATAACAALEAELDDALRRLPEKYRAALLLCYFQGRTVDQAAAELGCPRGTVASRLAQGRALLRGHLDRRGLALSSAGLLTFLLAKTATACPAPPLLQATLEAGMYLATHKAVAPAVPARVRDLIAGGARGLVVTRAVAVGLLLLALGGLVAAAGVAGHQPPPAPEQHPPQTPAATRDAPERPARTDAAGDPLPEGALARIGTVRFRHPDHVSRLAITADGKVLLSQAVDGIRTWNVATGKELNHFHRGYAQDVHLWDVSPDGRSVVVGPGPLTRLLILYDLRTGQVVRQIRQEASFQAARFAPDGTALLTTDGAGAIKLWDPATGKVRRSWKGPAGSLFDAVFSGDGKVLATFGPGGDGQVRFWDPPAGKLIRAFKVDASTARIALSADGKLLATLGSRYIVQQAKEGTGGSLTPDPDRFIRIWDTRAGKELRQIVLPRQDTGGFIELAFGPESKTLVTLDRDGAAFERVPALRVWDVATARERRRIPVDCYLASGLACSRDGRLVATMAGALTIRLFDARSGKDLAPPGPHQLAVRVALPGKGKTLVTVCDRTVQVWDTATGRPLRPPHTTPGMLTGVCYADRGAELFLRQGDGAVDVWDPLAGTLRRRLKTDAGTSGGALAATPDGKTLALADGKTVRVVDALTGKELRRFTGHEPWVQKVVFAEGGKKLVVFSVDHHVHVWDVAGGRKQIRYSVLRPRPETQGHASYMTAISPDGRLLAYGSQDKYLTLFELATGEEVARFTELPDGVCPMVFSPDGRSIIWGGWTAAPVRVLEVATGKERHRLVGHRGRVASLDLSANGKLLVSGSLDTTALVWDLSNRPTEERLSDDALAACWADLAGADAARAYRAMRRLAGDPARAVPFLDKRLQAVPAVSERRLKQHLADLRAPSFSVREKARRELEALGELAVPACREALQGSVPLEVRRRLENILEKHAQQRRTPPAEWVRGLRALEVLEMIGGRSALQTLDRIGQGAPGARWTVDATGAARRLRGPSEH
jgi:RNA polymerase sigma factor (sigma-70 family)